MNNSERSSQRPIVGRRTVRRFGALGLRHRPRARVAVVIEERGGKLRSYGPDEHPTMGEFLWAGSVTVYEIDLGLRHLRWRISVPASGDAFRFTVDLDLEWQVTDPEQIVRDNVRDVEAVLLPRLKQSLSRETRRYRVADVESAERGAQSAVDGLSLGREYGLACRVFVRLRTDETSVTHAQELHRVSHQITLEEQTQRLRELQESNRETLIRKRTLMYQEFVAAGLISQAALELAQNPDDVSIVMNMVRDERKEDRRQVTDFVVRLLDSNVIERHEVDDTVRESLAWLKDATEKAVGRPGQSAIPEPRRSTPLPAADIPEPLPESPMAAPPSDPPA